jgi:hypothetical protein
MKSSNPTPQNSGHITDSTEPGAHQADALDNSQVARPPSSDYSAAPSLSSAIADVFVHSSAVPVFEHWRHLFSRFIGSQSHVSLFERLWLIIMET